MRHLKAFVCGIVVLGLIGCGAEGKTKPETVNVSGTIYLKNKPLADADVNFISADGTFAAYGKTDASGKYTLAQGAVIGKNKVYISKKEGEEIVENPEEGMDAGQMEAAQIGNAAGKKAVGAIQLIPPEYSDPEKTKLSFDVPDGGTEAADFKL